MCSHAVESITLKATHNNIQTLAQNRAFNEEINLIQTERMNNISGLNLPKHQDKPCQAKETM